MYDRLTTRYTFACPEHGDTRVALSRFRRLERLPGAAHPAVFRVSFECGCGEEHPALVTHAELDWAPLGRGKGDSFLNLMTARLEALEAELERLQAGGHQVQERVALPASERRPVELRVGDESRMLLATPALEANPEDGGMRSTGQTLQPAEARQGDPRVAVLGTREGVPGC